MSSLARGAGLMMGLRLIERSIGLVSTLILARLLTPGDFGLVAMAMSVLTLIELMGAFGFDVALIQRQDAQRHHFDTAWTYNVLFSASVALLLLLCAPFAAEFYREPKLQLVLSVLAIGALVQGAENIGTVTFRKQMNFGQEFRFLLSKKLISFTVTMVLAFTLRNYWALVGGIIVGKVCAVLLSYKVHPFRPRFSLAASRDLFHFSKWLLVSNLILFLQNKSDSFILGRTVGAHDLGLYNVASEIAVLPSTELIAPINRAAFPAYSANSANLDALRAKFLSVFGFIGLLAFPMSVGLACVAGPAVAVLLGPQWAAAVPLLQLFTVCGLTSAIQSNLIMVIVALGKPKANTMLSGAMLVLYLPALAYASLQHGALGAAWVHLLMSCVVLAPLHVVFFKLTGLSPARYFGALWRPLAGALAMAAVVLLLQRQLAGATQPWPALVQLALCVCAGAISYVTMVLTLWHAAGRPAASAEAALLAGVAGRLRAAGKSPT